MCHHLSWLWIRFDPSLLNQVLSGAERLISCACDDRHSETGLIVEPVEEGVCFPLRGVGEGVHGFGAVNGHEDDMRGGIGDEVVGCRWRLCVEVVCHFGGVGLVLRDLMSIQRVYCDETKSMVCSTGETRRDVVSSLL